MSSLDTDILVVGNVKYLSSEDLRIAFGEDTHIIVVDSSCKARHEGKIRYFSFSVKDRRFSKLFRSYMFESVVYLSNSLDYGTGAADEMGELKTLMSECRDHHIERVAFITSQKRLSAFSSSDRLLLETEEDLCHHFADSSQISLKIIRCPSLLSLSQTEGYIFDLLRSAVMGQKLVISESPEMTLNFIASRDFAQFLYRLFIHWDANISELNLISQQKGTFRDLLDFLRRSFPETEISLDPNAHVHSYLTGEDKARRFFGWSVQTDIKECLPDCLAAVRNRGAERTNFLKRLIENREVPTRAIIILELILGEVLVEVLNRVLGNTVQFRMIDLRLLYVVLFAATYGSTVGFIAAFIAIISLNVAYYQRGSDWILLLYEPSNWLPFLLLMIVAAVLGYVKEYRDTKELGLNDEIGQLKERNDFLTDLYEESQAYKNEYKQNLIISRDGFGRIYDVVQKLSKTDPSSIMTEAIPVMEDVLATKSIAIYQIPSATYEFARLEVASRSLYANLPKSLDLKLYKPMMKEIQEGDIAVNTGLLPDYPMYAAGISDGTTIRALILLFHSEFSQTGTFYVNLIRVLRGLLENFLVRAIDYQRAGERENFIEGSVICRTDYLMKQLKVKQERMDRNLASFRIFCLYADGRSIPELNSMLGERVRITDTTGLGVDGNLYCLADFVDDAAEKMMLARFEQMGFRVSRVDAVPQEIG